MTEVRLKNRSRDTMVIRFRLTAAMKRADLDAGRRQETALREQGKLQTSDLNNLAWLALSAGKADQKALETIQEPILRTQAKPNPTVLHTAASLYA